MFERDEYPREGYGGVLSRLRPAFKPDGTVTRATPLGSTTAPRLSWSCREKAESLGLKPLAQVATLLPLGSGIMGLGPVEATRRALAKCDWQIDDLDLIEANEAFAVQSIAS